MTSPTPATTDTTATPGAPEVAVVSGGVGAARFLVALVDAVHHGLVAGVTDPSTITAIVNTGDDCVLHGLSISPDLDTVTYTLAGAIDPERGWGLVGEIVDRHGVTRSVRDRSTGRFDGGAALVQPR